MHCENSTTSEMKEYCHPYFCNANEFYCTKQDICIPASWRCDGRSDCLEDEDESMCECKEGEFKCAIGGGCINLEKKCDGIAQCGDSSDEWDCLRDNSTSNVIEVIILKNL